jgi:uncharacterized protein YbjT (DUF2867 family)
MARVFVSGGTGYVGASLLPELISRGHTVRALARAGSAIRVHPACEPAAGNALDASTFRAVVPPCDTFVHLVGTPHPAPWKGAQFRAIDRTSLLASLEAATYAGVTHFVYVSVAHPAPVMKDYIAVRSECEERLQKSRLSATILRPWYVLGPGHRWPYALLPLYWLGEAIPATREGALRLGLVTLSEMVRALVWAIQHPPESQRVLAVPAIRAVSSEVREVWAGA